MVRIVKSRSSQIGGRAPLRPSKKPRPEAQIEFGRNGIVWIINAPRRPGSISDYTYWLECLVRIIIGNTEALGKELRATKAKLQETRRENRELRRKLEKISGIANEPTDKQDLPEGNAKPKDDEALQPLEIVSRQTTRILELISDLVEEVDDITSVEITSLDNGMQAVFGVGDLLVTYTQLHQQTSTLIVTGKSDNEIAIKPQAIGLDQEGRLTSRGLDLLDKLAEAVTQEGYRRLCDEYGRRHPTMIKIYGHPNA